MGLCSSTKAAGDAAGDPAAPATVQDASASALNGSNRGGDASAAVSTPTNTGKVKDAAPLDPAASRPKEAREAFVQERWVPFLKELRRELLAVDERTLQRFSPEERMPSQRRVLELSHACMELTTEWYGAGKGNLSAVYEWLIRASASAGLSAYDPASIPATRSADGFTVSYDGRIRRRLYSAAKRGEVEPDDDEDENEDSGAGDERSRTRLDSVTARVLAGGESPIDNSLVSNLMTPDEAKVLLATGHVRKVLLAAIARKQRKQLQAISDALGGDPVLAAREPAEVREVLHDLVERSPDVLARAGIRTDTLSFRTLVSTGSIVRSWGQLDSKSQRRVRHYVHDAVMGRRESEVAPQGAIRSPIPVSASVSGSASAGAVAQTAAVLEAEAGAPPAGADTDAASPFIPRPSAEDSNDEEEQSPSPTTDRMREFVEWARKHPGRYFQDDKALHKKLLLLGMWTDSLSVVRRSAMEGIIPQRYVPFAWRRKVDLATLGEDGRTVRVLRAAGSDEHSRFRCNSFPYEPSHGLGVSSGGVEEGIDSWGNLVYEFGSGMPRDPAARLGNHFQNDFEKVGVEAVALSPQAGAAGMLPGEELHAVGQNPAAGSSIGATQHTQVAATTTASWPVTRLECRPEWVPALDAFVDVCQVGAHPDAFFLKIRTRRPDSVAVVGLLQSIRMAALRAFGGPDDVDFNYGVLPEMRMTTDAWFTAILAPVAALTFNGSRSETVNPDTGQSSAEAGLVGANLQDVLSLKGAAMTFTEEGARDFASGWPVLSRLYDFCRKPGARDLVQRELEERVGYTHRALGALSPAAVALPDDRARKSLAGLRRPVFFPLMKQASGTGVLEYVLASMRGALTGSKMVVVEEEGDENSEGGG